MKYLTTGKRYNTAKPRLIAAEQLKREKGFRANRSRDALAREPLYKSREWSELRQRVLAAEPRCRRCGAPAQHVDHLEHGPEWREHFFDIENLQPLCAPCHNSKSAKDRSAAKRAVKASKWDKYRKPDA